MADIKVKFAGYEGVLAVGKYPNGRLALVIVDEEEEDGLIATITSNLPDTDMEEDEVAIKTYSENEGILAAILPTGILKEPVTIGYSGHCSYPIYKVNMDLLENCRIY